MVVKYTGKPRESEPVSKTDELGQVLQGFRKTFGPDSANMGVHKGKVKRIPTGIFKMDNAMGGGFPRSRFSIVYGPESAGKTNLMLKTIGWVQNHCWECMNTLSTCTCRITVVKKAVIIDLEHTIDYHWAKNFINPDEMVYLQPENAEQVVDMVEGVLYAKETGLVIIDSIAAMVTSNEIESDGDKVAVGGASIPVSKMVRKATVALSNEFKRGHDPAVLCINQVRHKIGVMFGNPEYFNGGNALKFASSMTIRISGKNIMDKKVSEVMPIAKHTEIVIKKYKVQIGAISTEYDLVLMDRAGQKVGDCNTFKDLIPYLENNNILKKVLSMGVYECLGRRFKTMKEMEDVYNKDMVYRETIHRKVLNVNSENLLPPQKELPLKKEEPVKAVLPTTNIIKPPIMHGKVVVMGEDDDTILVDGETGEVITDED